MGKKLKPLKGNPIPKAGAGGKLGGEVKPSESNAERAGALKSHDKMMDQSALISQQRYGEDGKHVAGGTKQHSISNMYGTNRNGDQKTLHSAMLEGLGGHFDDKEKKAALGERDKTEAKAEGLGENDRMHRLYGAKRDKKSAKPRRSMLKDIKAKGADKKAALDNDAEERSEHVKKEAIAPSAQSHGMADEFFDKLSPERQAEYLEMQSVGRETLVEGEKVGSAAKVGFHKDGDEGVAVKEGKSDRFMQREVAVANVARDMGMDAVGQSAMMQTGEGDRVVSPLHDGESVQSMMLEADGRTEEGADAVKRLANADLDDVQQLVLNDIIFNNRDGHYGQYMLLNDGHMVKIDQEALGANGKQLVETSGGGGAADEDLALSGKADDMASASSFVAGLPSATAPLTAKTRAMIASWTEEQVENIGELMAAAKFQGGAATGGAEMFDDSVRERTLANVRKMRDMVAKDTKGTLSARDLFLEATKGSELVSGQGDDAVYKEREGVHPSMEALEGAKWRDKEWVPEDLRNTEMLDSTAQRYNVFGGYGKNATVENPTMGDAENVALATKTDPVNNFENASSPKLQSNWDVLEAEEKRQGGIRGKIAHEQGKADKKSGQKFRTKKSKRRQARKYSARIEALREQLNQGA